MLDTIIGLFNDPQWAQIGTAALCGLVTGLGISLVLGRSGSEIKIVTQEESITDSRRWENLPHLLVALSSVEESQKLYNSIVDAAREQLAAEYCALLLRRENDFVYEAGAGFCEETRQTFKLSGKEGVVSYMVEKYCPVMLAKGDRQLNMFRRLREPIKEAVIVPLRTGNELFGLLCIANKAQFGSFTRSDFDIANFLSVPFSLAINNATVFKNSQITVVNMLFSVVRQFESRSPLLTGHSARVADLAELTGQELRMNAAELESLRTAALLHDLGKLSVPSALHFAEEVPKGSEREAVSAQTKRAVALLKPLGFVDRSLPLILHCHEWYDGGGYPAGLRGPAVPIGSMVIAITEAYDYYTHDTTEQQAQSSEDAIKRLNQQSGTRFDPQILRAFLQALEKNAKAAAKIVAGKKK